MASLVLVGSGWIVHKLWGYGLRTSGKKLASEWWCLPVFSEELRELASIASFGG